jgi:ribonuclease J
MASDGIVIVIANIDANNNQLLGKINITTRGFVLVNDNTELLKQLEEISKNTITSKLKTPINYTDVKNEIITVLTPYIYDKTGRKPIILPVIMNVKKDIKQVA